MPRVNFFEFPAYIPERAIEFYKQVFGWKIEKWGDQEYWLVKTGESPEPGIDGAIGSSKTIKTTTVTVGVPSVDDFIKKITDAGGKVVKPKMPVPMMGWLAYCQDTEGTIFGIIQLDPSAK